MKVKVYCENCKHFSGCVQCYSPNNYSLKDSPIQKVDHFKDSPFTLNKKNDCKDYVFKKKPWYDWLLGT